MSLLYSYVLRYDDGAAPNPFWDVCTLTICKPVIRRKAKPGSWVIGTGSKHSACSDGTYDFSGMLVYAMKIDHVLSLSDYDKHCRKELPFKIPDKNSDDYKLHLGDAIYDYSNGDEPTMRNGKHNVYDRDRDLSGENSLLGTQFYYFGENPVLLPPQFQKFVKKNQGHKIIDDQTLIAEFEIWISNWEIGMHADPQLLYGTLADMNKDNSTCKASCSTKKSYTHSRHGSNCNI